MYERDNRPTSLKQKHTSHHAPRVASPGRPPPRALIRIPSCTAAQTHRTPHTAQRFADPDDARPHTHKIIYNLVDNDCFTHGSSTR